ncbi:hypothetical protein AAFF_G00088440 [Aldrovandia affinis]|uniref:Rho-GAP domain-containing protein n=1 Tax=Aldrovandia affinis TaxID=143900 RepID=A0AAD7RWG1_9TELE|nr:hypothetical protein AAFF_G00088440 [Aldrovandia affinis]
MRRGSYDDAAASIRPHLQNLAQRRRSAPSLAFSWALGKTWTPIREEGLCQVAVDQCPFVLGLTNENAELALDARVQLTEGLKTRERHLFLFSDILVIAKLKASCSYRLKHRVNLEQLWLITFEDEDGDVGINLKTSLFMAWPLAHCVVSFRSSEVKERWIETLHRKIKEATDRSGSPSSPPSILMTVLSGNVACKTLAGGGMDSVIKPSSDGNATPPPEQLCNTEDRGYQRIENASGGKWSLFQRKLRKSFTQPSPASSSGSSPGTLLFGQQLSKVCPEDGTLPKPIMEMLTVLLKKGTSTEGVFRKAGNVRRLKEVREQLNSGAEVDLGSQPIVLLAALLKDFLRQLPGSLLLADQYNDWMATLEKDDVQERCTELKQVIDTLPRANVGLLQLLLCVLHHISHNASANKMDAKNLAICIAPNLLQRDNMILDTATVDKVTTLTQFLIENCCRIFGEHIQTLLGDPDEEEEELIDNSEQLLTKQGSDDSFLLAGRGEGGGERGGAGVLPPLQRSWAAVSGPRDGSCSSSCSLESSFSNQSENSVFTSSPLASPSACRRALLLPRPQSISPPKGVEEPPLPLPLPLPVPLPPQEKEREVKRRAQSMRSNAKTQRRARSWSNAFPRRGSLKKGDPPQKEGFPCETLREDPTPSEAEPADPAPIRAGLRPRPRPLSAVEVFQQVDSRIAAPPPAYELALQSGAQPAPPQYRTLTVRGARELERKSRPSSVGEELLLRPYATQAPMDCHTQDTPTVALPPLDTPALTTPPLAFRQRTMSESVPHVRQRG